MTLVLAISRLEADIFAAAGLLLVGSLVTVKLSFHIQVDAVPRLLRLTRWFLGLSLPLLLLLAGLIYYLEGWRIDNSGSILRYGFVGLPILFALAYSIGALQLNVLLHLIVGRYYREQRCVNDQNVGRAIRRMAARSRWLHPMLTIGSRMRFSEVLDQVCPEVTQEYSV